MRGGEQRGVADRADQAAVGRAVEVERSEQAPPPDRRPERPPGDQQPHERQHRVAARVGALARAAGRPIREGEPGRGRADRLEHPLDHVALVRQPRHRGDQLAEDQVADVGVGRVVARLELWLPVAGQQALDHVARLGARLASRVDPPQRRRVGDPRAVVEQMADGDPLVEPLGARRTRAPRASSSMLAGVGQLHDRGGRGDLGHREPQKRGLGDHGLPRRRCADAAGSLPDDPPVADQGGGGAGRGGAPEAIAERPAEIRCSFGSSGTSFARRTLSRS